jgi:hypothetical protein
LALAIGGVSQDFNADQSLLMQLRWVGWHVNKRLLALASNSALWHLAVGIILRTALLRWVSIGPNTTAMGSFLGAPGAWAGLFQVRFAKGYIVASTALVNIVAATH